MALARFRRGPDPAAPTPLSKSQAAPANSLYNTPADESASQAPASPKSERDTASAQSGVTKASASVADGKLSSFADAVRSSTLVAALAPCLGSDDFVVFGLLLSQASEFTADELDALIFAERVRNTFQELDCALGPNPQDVRRAELCELRFLRAEVPACPPRPPRPHRPHRPHRRPHPTPVGGAAEALAGAGGGGRGERRSPHRVAQPGADGKLAGPALDLKLT